MTTEVIDIRRFEAHDFAALLEAESRAWDEELHWDYTSAARVISNCLEDKRLMGYALVNEGRIEGYSFFLCEGEKGLIGDVFVVRRLRQQAPDLVNRVLETLMATPGIARVEAQLPHFGRAELEACFLEHEFKSYTRRFMSLRLDSNRPAREPASFAIEPWERRHDHLAAHFIYRTYRGHIDAFINDQYSSSEGAERLIDNIFGIRGCGEPVAQGSMVAIHRPTQKIAGLLALTAVGPKTAHIPQVAVAPEFQSAGLGTSLLDLAFRKVASQGYREISLTVTDLNQGARRLYERLGFETFRTFGAFLWIQP